MNQIFQIFSEFIKFFIIYWPGSSGRKIRFYYYKNKFKSCGTKFFIDEGVIIESPQNISVGDNVWIDRYCVLLAGKSVSEKSERIVERKSNPNFTGIEGELIIKKNVHIAPFCVVQAHAGIEIGENCGIAAGTKVYSMSHHYKNPKDESDKFEYRFTPLAPEKEQSLILGPIVISDNCAVGLNSVILPGVTVKSGTWVGVLSYIYKDTEEKSIYGAKPASFLKNKF